MNGIRKLLLLTAVTLLLAPLTPAYGATKQYSGTLSPLSGNQTTISIDNLTSGNSVIKSWTLAAPAGYAITSASAVAPYTATISPSCSAGSPCQSIQVNYATGIQPLTIAQVALTITAPAASSCSQSATWTSAAYTGNNIGGQPFNLVGGQPTLTVVTGCALQFLTQPANGSVGATITNTVPDNSGIRVGVTDGHGNVQSWFTGGIALANAGPGTGTLSGGGSKNAVSGVASFTSLALSASGVYALKASSSGFTSVTSNQFVIFDGVLNCDPTPPFDFGTVGGDEDQPGYAEGLRWFWNKDGVSCIPLLYSFKNFILTPDPVTGIGNAVQLSWDTTTGQHPAFMYSATFKPEDIDTSTGMPVPRSPYVAFNTVGAPNFVPGIACFSNKLPSPYAMLPAAAGIGAGDTSFTVVTPPTVPAGYPTATFPSTSNPATPNFPIVIDTERMLVTGVSGNTLYVMRGQGGTTAAPHSGNAYVMSTPLPLDPVSGMQIPICVVKFGWIAEGLDPVTGIAQASWTMTVFDLGDSWIQPR